MTGNGQKRGPVGLAAETLKEALVAKLQPGVKDSPLNDGIYQSIKLVEAFLYSYRESQSDLDALKSQIKRIMMSQIAARASPPPQRPGDHRAHSATDAQPSTSQQAGADLGGGRVQLYSRTSHRSSSSASMDWTLPQRTLNRKAYVRSGDFGRMTLVQDDLARKADVARQMEEADRKRATLAVVNEQMAIVEKRKEDEREARRRAQLDMDEEIRQYHISEEARIRNQKDAQATLRNFYAGQVDEHQTRKREEMQLRIREHEGERQQLLEEERRERARLEQLARENAAQREHIKRALLGAMGEKAAAKAALVEEELRYNREYMKKMDADEAARRRAVAIRQEKTRLAVERGGGAALQASFEEQERADAARAERLAAEVEAVTMERERRDHERRKKAAEDALRELDGQIAAREAERKAAAEAEEKLRREIRAQEAAARKAREEAKAARRVAQAETLESQKAAVAEQHRRRYHEYREPFEDRYRWLHAGPLSGTQRAFNNLAVPDGKAALLAGMEL